MIVAAWKREIAACEIIEITRDVYGTNICIPTFEKVLSRWVNRESRWIIYAGI